MITDMVGYSREMQRSEDGTLRKRMKHNELLPAPRMFASPSPPRPRPTPPGRYRIESFIVK